MSDLGNKEVFSKNLRRYIDLSGKERKEVAEELGFSYSTFTDWVNGNSYPRIDRIEKLANYFGIKKSDLIESELHTSYNAVAESLGNYYVNDEARQMAQEIFENPELRILFDASRNLKKEDIEAVIEITKRLKGNQ